jgi:hypothetical protein
MNDEKKVSMPRLPDFQLTPAQIETALQRPIRKKYRRELVLPEEKNRANAWNRIVVKGIIEFQDQTSMPIATLIRQLLVLYFTGNLSRSDVQSISAGYDFDEHDDLVESDDVVNEEFDFPGMRLDQ